MMKNNTENIVLENETQKVIATNDEFVVLNKNNYKICVLPYIIKNKIIDKVILKQYTDIYNNNYNYLLSNNKTTDDITGLNTARKMVFSELGIDAEEYTQFTFLGYFYDDKNNPLFMLYSIDISNDELKAKDNIQIADIENITKSSNIHLLGVMTRLLNQFYVNKKT